MFIHTYLKLYILTHIVKLSKNITIKIKSKEKIWTKNVITFSDAEAYCSIVSII